MNWADWTLGWLAERPPKKDFLLVSSVTVPAARRKYIYRGHAVLRGCSSFCDKNGCPVSWAIHLGHMHGGTTRPDLPQLWSGKRRTEQLSDGSRS